MAGTEIDFGNIQQAQVPQPKWQPPPRKYFGPKDPETGQMIAEPEYVHQDYPCMRYALKDGKIRAQQCADEKAVLALGEGWYDTPAVFGAVTAPTFEESRKPAPQLKQPAKAA